MYFCVDLFVSTRVRFLYVYVYGFLDALVNMYRDVIVDRDMFISICLWTYMGVYKYIFSFCIFFRVCVYVPMYICVYGFVYIRAYRKRACMSHVRYVYVYMYIFVCACARMCLSMLMCIYTRLCRCLCMFCLYIWCLWGYVCIYPYVWRPL